MKKRNFGFTLIELLVVIVIIGILATISTATFKSYFGKARDAERQSAVQNIALMIKVDGADDWTSSKYIYDAAGLTALMDANDFRLPNGKNNICYFVGMAIEGGGSVGDVNEFVVGSWGELTSTSQTGTAGVLADGTQAAIDAIDVDDVESESFACDSADMTDVSSAFEAGTYDSADTFSYLFINELGVIEGVAGFPTPSP
jgi:prepilin-type N-terminal cleavage/methylation domain-containing protein